MNNRNINELDIEFFQNTVLNFLEVKNGFLATISRHFQIQIEFVCQNKQL